MAQNYDVSSVLQVIGQIADAKVVNADYDRTVVAVISDILNPATGKYKVKYQDSEFEAYAVHSDLSYYKGQRVTILISNNDMQKSKYILNAVTPTVTNYKSVSQTQSTWEQLGTNVVTDIGEWENLSSYKDNSIIIYEAGTAQNKATVDKVAIENYFKQGKGFLLGMTVRTKMAASQKINGQYGVKFTMKFKDNVSGSAAVRQYVVSSTDVIGNPYNLYVNTPVRVFVGNVNTDDFLSLEKIELFSREFPADSSKTHIKDILISKIHLAAATGKQLEQGDKQYELQISYASKGNIVNVSIPQIELEATLKVNGKIAKDDVTYYWFREDGSVLPGAAARYSPIGGYCWDCINPQHPSNGQFIESKQRTADFCGVKSQEDLTKLKAYINSRVMRVKCVAMYDGTSTQAQVTVYNHLLSEYVQIISSDRYNDSNLDTYYYNNGKPDLTSKVFIDNISGEPIWQTRSRYIFKWSVRDKSGDIKVVESSATSYNNFISSFVNYNGIEDKQVKMPFAETVIPTEDGYNTQVKEVQASKREEFKNSSAFLNAKSNYQLNVVNASFVYKDVYYHFPVKDIQTLSRVTVAAFNGDTYVGTHTFTIYNKNEVSGKYSLQINGAVQCFQYDGKGISPASKQRKKPIELFPLTFTFKDGVDQVVPYSQIISKGSVSWIIPKEETMLSINFTGRNGHAGGSKEDDWYIENADIALAADSYQVYSSLDGEDTEESTLQEFAFKIAEHYDQNSTLNNIWLHVVYCGLAYDAYTNFTFPKDGDPGEKGNTYVPMLAARTRRAYLNNGVFFNDNGQTFTQLNFTLYNDGTEISLAQLKELEGEDNVQLNTYSLTDVASLTDTDNMDPSTRNLIDPETGKRGSSFTNMSINGLNVYQTHSFANNFEEFISKNPINIFRAQVIITKKVSNTNSLDVIDDVVHYYDEYPICYEVTNPGLVYDYRIKIKQSSGFTDVVYQYDGTNPKYDTAEPFTIVVERKAKGSSDPYKVLKAKNYKCTWGVKGNLTKGKVSGNTAVITPKNTYNGIGLISAVTCKIVNNSGNLIGWIHIPVYMCLERYNNQGLSDWDGNSIKIDEQNGIILAPQIGAGMKETAEDGKKYFTGMLMGVEHYYPPATTQKTYGDQTYTQTATIASSTTHLDPMTNENGDTWDRITETITSEKEVTDFSKDAIQKVGLFGFSKGARTIFLDARTGKTELGRAGSGQIVIDPNSSIYSQTSITDDEGHQVKVINRKKNVALIYSGNFNADKYIETANENNGEVQMPHDAYEITEQDEEGSTVQRTVSALKYKSGLMIDLTSPAIVYGNGNFYVNPKGQMYAQAGTIAGWKIGKTSLTSTFTYSGTKEQTGIGSLKNAHGYVYGFGPQTTAEDESASGTGKIQSIKYLHANNFHAKFWTGAKPLSSGSVGRTSDTGDDKPISGSQVRAMITRTGHIFGRNLYCDKINSQGVDITQAQMKGLKWRLTKAGNFYQYDDNGNIVHQFVNGTLIKKDNQGNVIWKISSGGDIQGNGWDITGGKLTCESIDCSGEMKSNTIDIQGGSITGTISGKFKAPEASVVQADEASKAKSVEASGVPWSSCPDYGKHASAGGGEGGSSSGSGSSEG